MPRPGHPAPVTEATPGSRPEKEHGPVTVAAPVAVNEAVNEAVTDGNNA